jgi:hypothetical protein
MESQSIIVSLHLPSLLAACLDFGDSPQILTGRLSISNIGGPEPTILLPSAHDDIVELDLVNIDVLDHVERCFWGLRFSGSILALRLPPSLPAPTSLIPRDSSSVIAVTPHRSCIWLRYSPLYASSITISHNLCSHLSASPDDIRSHISAHVTYNFGIIGSSVHIHRGAAIVFSCDFVDGLPHGPSTSYWGIESSVASCSTWTSGSGLLRLFHDNSSPFRSETFTDGLKHGTSSEYRRDGTLRYSQEYELVMLLKDILCLPETCAHFFRRG